MTDQPSLTHISHGKVCLGRKEPRRSLKSLPLSLYTISHGYYPRVNAWERPIEWGMLANDRLGDCTCAAVLHMIMGWKAVANAGTPCHFKDEDAVSLYETVGGYNPANPSSDQGAVELDVLNYWRDTGVDGDKIAGYATLDISNTEQIKAACYTFGGVYIGFNVPSYIMDVPAGGSWSTKPGDFMGIIGGHAVNVVGYGRAGARVVSWGSTYTFNWQFWLDYVDEAYAVVNPDWIKQSGRTPSNFDLA